MIAGSLALPVALPLLAAGSAILTGRRRTLTRVTVLAANLAVLALGALLLHRTADGSVLTKEMGGWLPGVAIVFAVDTFGALMLCTTSLLVVVCLIFAAGTGDDRHPLFAPLTLLLVAGVYGALLTADLFNLFVLIEVMLAPSYALLTLTGGRTRVAAGRLYLVVNLLASTLFLGGLAVLYGVAGTLNLADLAGSAREVPEIAVAGGVLMLAMATKAAVVPLHGWLPRTYPAAGPAVTALFSGLLTKVGVYVIIRLYSVLYDGDPQWLWLVMTAALLTMVVGVLGAVGEHTMRSILTFHMVSQIGYILLGLALFTEAGVAAAVFYLVQYVLVKAALLVCAGSVEAVRGDGRLDGARLARREPLLALAFVVAAFSLAGLPPFSGFVAKLTLLRAAALDGAWLAVALAVAVSLLTLLSMLKIWTGVFAGSGAPPVPADCGSGRPERRAGPGLIWPAVALASFSVLLGLGAEPLLVLSQTAAAGLVDISTWVEAVRTP
ncbi:monovalent cation/H+ antiporter subunit D family protein [Streptomyces sp. ST2-7A]|uniref:monovalent cation/H+ antiporter subunit D family protein n=1 Tax=Streptomyces sp. ST2-7A TaxID=2907214 RepID=UPI001F2E5F24|nr:monovalent cation/H+ antiporter subunit D family protein [Streptomyces sp. ST2-7A]MCE7082673.1 monovalent cation/H+ antiporter subunit D family protein [Streptomyces sp. ST2-7A]